MLIRFLRFWRGTMEFQISGKYLERFLNLAARARIPIWDGRREEQVFYGKTLVSNGPQLRKIAEKVQLQWQQSDYKGAPQLQKRYRKRFGIAGGGILLLILMLLSQQFVWMIRVKGNAQVSDTAVIQLAEQLGLRPGVWKKSLDVIEIADELTVQLEQVSWAAINLLGTVAEVEIVERVMPPEVLDEETPCNVVAKKAGQLVELFVYDGKSSLKVGDTVKQGELLVSGIWEDKNGRTFYRHAQAKAVVEYIYEDEIRIPLISRELAAAGNHENSYRLLLGEWSLPLSVGSAPNGADFSTDEGLVESGVYHNDKGQWFYSVHNKALSFLGFPLSLQIQQYIPAQEVELIRSEEKAKDMALWELEQLKRRLEADQITIVGQELQGKKQGKDFVLTLRLRCQEEISEEAEIFMEETEKE